LQATQQLKSSENLPSNGGIIEVSAAEGYSSNSKPLLSVEKSSDTTSQDFSGEYMQLQLRIYRLMLILTAIAVLLFTIFVDFRSAISFLVGALSGIFYLRLLARGIGKLGKSSMSVSKIQLLVPVLLFFAASKFHQFELLPAFLGFLLYKPSLIIQFLLEP